MALISADAAMKLVRQLRGGASAMELIKKVLSDEDAFKGWLRAENEYHEIRGVAEMLGGMVWEDRQDEIDELSRDAEIECEDKFNTLNEYREKLGIEKEPQ